MIAPKNWIRLWSIVFFLSSLAFSGFGQEERGVTKLWNKFFNDTIKTGKPKFIAYPVVGYTPETSWEFGAGALMVYNAKKDLDNRLSELYAFSFLTLENQYGLWIDHALYTDQNNYFLLGKFRLQQFPLAYYGIGVDTPDEPVAKIEGFALTLRERWLRKLKDDFYAGLEIDLNHLSSVRISDVTSDFSNPSGTEGYTNFGLGIGLVYDQRYDVLNPREGVLLEGAFLHYDGNWGSDYTFQDYFLDFRYYQPTFKNQVLAYQMYWNLTSPSDEGAVPFNQLSLMGGESLMRGYYTGRYRDNLLVATQAEYRFLPLPFSKHFGATLFAGVGAVSPGVVDLKMDQVRASGGLGVRYLLFPSKDVYTRFDVAATTGEGLGYYFFIGEAF
ncbi:MAG: BamA/TamA family outer membrane protein [Salibacteraceae bacterium]